MHRYRQASTVSLFSVSRLQQHLKVRWNPWGETAVLLRQLFPKPFSPCFRIIEPGPRTAPHLRRPLKPFLSHVHVSEALSADNPSLFYWIYRVALKERFSCRNDIELDCCRWLDLGTSCLMQMARPGTRTSCLLQMARPGTSCLLQMARPGTSCLLQMARPGTSCLLQMARPGTSCLLQMARPGTNCLLQMSCCWTNSEVK